MTKATYKPFDARDENTTCGACLDGELTFIGGTHNPGWMGTPDGDTETYECDACGETGQLSARGNKSASRAGACAAPDAIGAEAHR